MIFLKLHISGNICLKIMIYTSNGSSSNIQLADDVGYEIYFEKNGEIKFQKNHSEIFFGGSFRGFLTESSKNHDSTESGME